MRHLELQGSVRGNRQGRKGTHLWCLEAGGAGGTSWLKGVFPRALKMKGVFQRNTNSSEERRESFAR